MKLTEKQKRFCEEYLVDLNATQEAGRRFCLFGEGGGYPLCVQSVLHR